MSEGNSHTSQQHAKSPPNVARHKDARAPAQGRGRGPGVAGWPGSFTIPGGRSTRAASHAASGWHNGAEHRSDTLGRWGKASLPQAEPVRQELNVRQLGVVQTIEHSSGFIKCLTGNREPLRFEISEVQQSAAPAAGSNRPAVKQSDSQTAAHTLSAGTPVEFTVQSASVQSNPSAVQVKVVPGFVDTTQHGTIERELRGGHKRREDAYGGRISWQPPQLRPSDSQTDTAAAAAAAADPDTNGPPGIPQSPATDADVDTGRVRLSDGGGQHDSGSAHSRVGKEMDDGRPTFSVPFEGVDTEEDSGRMPVGQTVSFKLVHDSRSGQLRAQLVSPVEVAPQPQTSRTAPSTTAKQGERELGHVVTLKEKFGFLLSVTSGRRLFFHFSEAGFPTSSLAEGAELSFGISDDTESGREAAVALQLLAPGTIAAAADEELPGRVTGRVVSAPTGSAAWGVLDGIASYADPATGLDFHCSFGSHQMPSGEAAVQVGDQLELGVVVNMRTGARRATHVAVVSRSGAQPEFGKVVSLKPTWGLIRAPGRSLDIFFHFSSLQPPLQGAELAAEHELRFTVTCDPNSHKLAATEVSRAPPGSVMAEETVGEEVLTGTVEQRLMMSRGTTALPGLLAYSDPTTGLPLKLPFGPRDLADDGVNPGVGDEVSFCLAANHAAVQAAQAVGGKVAMYAGRRATKVALPTMPGHVVNVKPSFGFADVYHPGSEGMDGESKTEPLRTYFQTSEVVDKVQLRAGDSVEMVLATDARTGNRTGRRVRRTPQIAPPASATSAAAAASGDRAISEGAGTTPSPHHGVKEKKPQSEFVAERNPNAVKYIGHKVELQATREVKGPDGTRGFEPGHWCATRQTNRRPLPQQQQQQQQSGEAPKVPRDATSSKRGTHLQQPQPQQQQQQQVKGYQQQPQFQLQQQQARSLVQQQQQQQSFEQQQQSFEQQQQHQQSFDQMLAAQVARQQARGRGGFRLAALTARPPQPQAPLSAFGAPLSAKPASSRPPAASLPRQGSTGRLSAAASAFVPRSASGNLLADSGAAAAMSAASAGSEGRISPAAVAPPASQPQGNELPTVPSVPLEARLFLTPAASLDYSTMSGSEGLDSCASPATVDRSTVAPSSQQELLCRAASQRALALSSVQSEAFFTPAASLARPLNADGDIGDGLPDVLQLQEAAARMALLQADNDDSDSASR